MSPPRSGSGRIGIDGLFLGIDCGTQGLKTLVLDGAHGAVVALARRTYDVLPTAKPGVSEQDPAVWIAAARGTIREVTKALGPRRARRIRAIAVSGQQHGMVALDADGRVLRPAKLWNDVSTAAEAGDVIRRCGGPAAMRRRTGNSLPPGFTASKVRWLWKREPEHYRRTKHILLPHDYINYWLTGEIFTEAGDASGTGYFNIKTRSYDPDVVRAVAPGLDRRLPRVVDAGAMAGHVRASLAAQLGLPAGVAVGHGGGDNMMAAFGTGATRRGIVTVSLGTSGTAFGFSRKPVVDPAGEIAAFCDSSGGYLPLLCIQNCTVSTEFAKRILTYNDSELDRAAARCAPGSGGLLLLPFFGGERTPNLPHARAAFAGFTPENATRDAVARASMEAPAFGLAYGLRRLERLGLAVDEVRLTGGGSRSRTWRSILASVFGVPVVCTSEAEGAAYGAALCALWCAAREADRRCTADGVCSRFVAVDDRTRVEPQAGPVAAYRELYERRIRLIELLYQ